jgi:bifunctional DNA-binding transcriptional regulator/antitoxin component of YhaV-PrlF toxin-antitoxin module
MVKVEVRPIDSQGRIILPKAWREKHKSKTVFIIDENDRLEIRAGDEDLSRFLDAVDTEVKDFDDYHTLRKGLRKHAVH